MNHMGPTTSITTRILLLLKKSIIDCKAASAGAAISLVSKHGDLQQIFKANPRRISAD